MRCGAWLRAPEEQEDTGAYERQHCCSKSAPYVLPLVGHGRSALPIVLPLPSPAQPLTQGKSPVTGWGMALRHSPDQRDKMNLDVMSGMVAAVLGPAWVEPTQ